MASSRLPWPAADRGQIVERSNDQIVAGVFSLSSSTPYLFGDRRDAFEADLRQLLHNANPGEIFSEQMREMPPTSGGRTWAECEFAENVTRDEPAKPTLCVNDSERLRLV